MKKTAAFMATAFLLAGCGPSGNDVACHLYEESYNKFADAVAAGEPSESILDLMDDMDVRIGESLATASGEVRTQMEASKEAASLVTPSDTGDASLNFFVTTSLVATACSDSGNPIDLRSLSGE